MMRAILVRGAFFCIVWWMLTGGSFYAWPVGLVTIALAVAVSIALYPPNMHRVRVRRVPGFFLFFLVKSIKGGVQVAAMALRPRLALHPEILELHLRLPHEAERIFLASILSLLPGTLSAGLDGNLLHLHVLDSRHPIEEEVRTAEDRVALLFGTVLR